MNQDSPAISIKGLKKSYGQIQALRGLDLEVNRGEIYGFLGPNGAGKTTTIRCLLDLIRPDSGTVRVLGRNPQKDSVAVRDQAGYLPGELSLDPNMRVGRALRYLNALSGRKSEWSNVQQLSERLNLDLSTPIKNLSKGNKQKVGVVQALMGRPDLLLLDEPTSGLDPLIQREVHLLLKEAQSDGATVFFSSHFISEVEAIAERVGIIRGGRMIEEAQPSQLGRMDVRLIQVRFLEPTSPESLIEAAGVMLISREELTVTVQVAGELDGFLKAVARYPVSDMIIERPSLEEIFMTYYKGDEREDLENVG